MLMSCTKYGSPVAEYGVPFPEDKMNFYGIVMSQDSLKPIPNILVKAYADGYDTVTTTTNQSGKYSLYKYAYENQKVKLVFTDTDSIQNGNFFNKNIEVEVSFRDVNNQEHEANIYLQRKP